MNFKIILSALFLIICQSAFSQENSSVATNRNRSLFSEKGMTKVSVMYPYSEGNTFNMEYYETRHMPMVAVLLGENLVKFTIEKGIASGIPNTPLPFIAIGTFYVKNLGEYQKAIQPNRDAIRADFPKYTNITPLILVSEVIW